MSEIYIIGKRGKQICPVCGKLSINYLAKDEEDSPGNMYLHWSLIEANEKEFYDYCFRKTEDSGYETVGAKPSIISGNLLKYS